MTSYRLGALATALAVSLTTAAQAEVMTLNTALSAAYEGNPQLAAERANLRATDEGVAQANAGWRPTINAQGQYGVEHEQYGASPPFSPTGGDINERPLQGQLTINQPIFRGGKTYAEIGRAKALVRQGRAALLDTEQQVMIASVTAYMNVARDEATVKLEENNVAVLQKQLDATSEQFKVGELTKTDVAQSQARLAGAQAQLTIGRGQLAASRASFEQVIGRPAEALDDQPVFPNLPKTEDQAIDIAAKSSPIILSARESEKAADYAVDDAIGSLAPQISVQGQYQYQQLGAGAAAFGQPGTAHVGSVFGMVTVPIYQGGAEEASIRQAKELHSQTQLLIANADRQVRANAQSTWEAYVSAQASIQSDKVQVQADQTALEGVHKEQEVGARTILDVLNAQQELLNAQVAVISAERDAYVAAFTLLQATGQLTAHYLALNVKFYDETEHYDDDANRWIGFGN
ncbi:MAG TPA: TolC family outer membrane protein [Rhizomicrobium sp.]